METRLLWKKNEVNQTKRKIEMNTKESNSMYLKDSLDHCAEIPEVMCRRVTNRELAKWIAQGNGQCYMSGGRVWTEYNYDIEQDDYACSEFIKVRKWCDKEWHEPTLDYLGLEESK